MILRHGPKSEEFRLSDILVIYTDDHCADALACGGTTIAADGNWTSVAGGDLKKDGVNTLRLSGSGNVGYSMP